MEDSKLQKLRAAKALAPKGKVGASTTRAGRGRGGRQPKAPETSGLCIFFVRAGAEPSGHFAETATRNSKKKKKKAPPPPPLMVVVVVVGRRRGAIERKLADIDAASVGRPRTRSIDEGLWPSQKGGAERRSGRRAHP